MPTPRPIDPYRTPKRPEKPGGSTRSTKRLSGPRLVLVFFSPVILFLLFLGLALFPNYVVPGFFKFSFLILMIAMIAVCGVFANHFAGDKDDRAGRLIGFFLLTAVAQIFVNTIVAFGGCLMILSSFG